MATPRRFAFDIIPREAQPRSHLLPRQHGKRLLHRRWPAIFAAFSEKQNVLSVVLDNRAGLIRLAIKPRSVSFRFRNSIRNLEPKNGGKRVESDRSGPHHDIRMQRHDAMASLLTGNANV